MSASACTPPTHQISSAPASAIDQSISGNIPLPSYGGAQATTRSTPATLAVRMLICADISIGYLPPGT